MLVAARRAGRSQPTPACCCRAMRAVRAHADPHAAAGHCQGPVAAPIGQHQIQVSWGACANRRERLLCATSHLLFSRRRRWGSLAAWRPAAGDGCPIPHHACVPQRNAGHGDNHRARGGTRIAVEGARARYTAYGCRSATQPAGTCLCCDVLTWPRAPAPLCLCVCM